MIFDGMGKRSALSLPPDQRVPHISPVFGEMWDTRTSNTPALISLLKIPSMMYGEPMAGMTIRDIDEKLKARLRVQAARHGRSMEEEARDILRTALSVEATRTSGLVEAIRSRIEPLGGVELRIAPRESMREPIHLDK
jgi:antitoxin FitA